MHGVDLPKLKTKHPTLDAALHLFARRGFQETSVQDIAKRANVDEASVVRHFGDKQRLYAEVVQLAGDRFLCAMHGHLESKSATLAENLEQWVRGLAHAGETAALIRTGTLAQGDSAPRAVVESLQRRLVDFWQRRLSSISEPVERRLRHRELAQFIVAVAPVFAAAREAGACRAATPALADFVAAVAHMATDSEAYTMYRSAPPVSDAICRSTPSLFPREESDEPVVSLSPRELQVLFEVEGGASNKGVARVLGVTETTVKFHLRRIYRKFGVQRRTEALKAARRRGLI